MNSLSTTNLEKFSKAFTSVMHLFHNLASKVSRMADLSLAQYRMLMIVYHIGPMSINDLKTRLNIAQSTASEMADRLVQLGLFIRGKNPQDRRITIFSVAEKTYKILDEHKSVMQNVYRKVLQPLTPHEQQELVEAFETILRLMKQVEKNKA